MTAGPASPSRSSRGKRRAVPIAADTAAAQALLRPPRPLRGAMGAASPSPAPRPIGARRRRGSGERVGLGECHARLAVPGQWEEESSRRRSRPRGRVSPDPEGNGGRGLGRPSGSSCMEKGRAGLHGQWALGAVVLIPPTWSGCRHKASSLTRNERQRCSPPLHTGRSACSPPSFPIKGRFFLSSSSTKPSHSSTARRDHTVLQHHHRANHGRHIPCHVT